MQATGHNIHKKKIDDIGRKWSIFGFLFRNHHFMNQITEYPPTKYSLTLFWSNYIGYSRDAPIYEGRWLLKQQQVFLAYI